ncbi:MAG: hypothetical protein LAO79_03550 [Acidobacteriia bacterium]|nr:hypothetical protein [Terriglobia bacterium]
MSVIDILEEAAALLRRAPMAALVAYLFGAAPFLIAFLFFLNDMTRSPFAAERLAPWSLGLALLFVWKNVWKARFSAGLYETLSPGSQRPASLLRLIAIQAALQPLRLAVMLPVPGFAAFFRNAGIFLALGTPDPLRAARRQAALWTRQNWAVVAIVALGSLVLFVNVLLTIAMLPQLARSFLGIEGELARLGGRIVNLSSAATAAAITWLIVDPFLEAVYVLRCYYGESIATGEDLLAAFKRATAMVALAIACTGIARAQVDSEQLDHSIDQVIHSREFTWRAPRVETQEPDSKFAGWLRAAQQSVARFFNWLGDIIRRLLEQAPKPEADGKEAAVSRRTMELLIGVALALVVAAGIVFFLRRQTPVVAATPVTVAAAVNLADESVTADQLPESSWLQLADEWLAKGDARLALRALYLAGLNHLGGRGLVSITRWKSGLDYRVELERRARATPEVGREFARLTGIFEYGWYGVHGVDRAMVDSFASGLNAMRSYAEHVQ